MSISFYCESCYQVVETPVSTANKKGRCPHCGHIQMIPASSNLKPSTSVTQVKSTVDALLEDVQELSGQRSKLSSKSGDSGQWEKGKRDAEWGDDRYASKYLSELERRDRTSRALSIPAIGIILCGILQYIASGIAVATFALYMLGTAASDEFSPTFGLVMLVLVGWNCLIATLGIVGANHMKQVRSYSMSVGGALLMCLPHAVWPVGILFGLWAIVLLAKAENRDTFRKA